MGTSFVRYDGRGFWTRDSALATVLALLVTELAPEADGVPAVEAILDHWALHAVMCWGGMVDADLDRALADGLLASDVTGAIGRIRARLPAEGLVQAGDPAFLRRAQQVSDTEPVSAPRALAIWVHEVLDALGDLLEGRLAALPDAYWFVDGNGRHQYPQQHP